MLSNILNPKKTVADVLTVFNQAIADLEKVEQTQQQEVERQAIAVEQAQAAKAAAAVEVNNAVAVRKKLLAIINP